MSDLLKGVSIITITKNISNIDLIFNNFLRQNYDNKELIIILNSKSLDLKRYQEKVNLYNNIKILKSDEESNNGKCINLSLNYIDNEYIALFNDSDFYAPNYLSQSINTFKVIDGDIVGKFTTYVYFTDIKSLAIKNYSQNFENKYSPGIESSTMVFKRKILNKILFPSSRIAENKFQIFSLNYGFKIYSTNRYNYVSLRNSINDNISTSKANSLQNDYKIIAENITDYTNIIASKINTLNNMKSNYNRLYYDDNSKGWGVIEFS